VAIEVEGMSGPAVVGEWLFYAKVG